MNAVWKMPDGEGGYYTIYHETTAEMVKYSDTTVANVLDGLGTSSASEFMQSVLRAEDAKAVRKLLSVNKLLIYDESETTWTSTGAPVVLNGEVTFDGASYLCRGAYVLLGGADPFTIEFVAKANVAGSATSPFVQLYMSDNYQITIGENSTFPRLFWKYNNTTIIGVNGAESIVGTARHIAVTYDGTTIRYFVDGQKVHELAKTLTQQSYRLFLGANYLASSGFSYSKSTLDEFRLSDVCRYTENFTPAARHDFDEHTLSLLHFD